MFGVPTKLVIILTVILPVTIMDTRLSSKGQVVIPQEIRKMNHWLPGQELIAVNTDEGVLFKPKRAFAATTVEDLTKFRPYKGKTKSVEEMNDAVREQIVSRWEE